MVYPKDSESKGKGRGNKRSTILGFTMAQLVDQYPSNMDPKDIQCLKKLTTNTLFCKFCYRPFLQNKVMDETTAVTIYFVSAIEVCCGWNVMFDCD